MIRSVLNTDIFDRPTYKTFMALFDNYDEEVGVEEDFTFQEKLETKRFINAIVETDIGKMTHRKLIEEDLLPDDSIRTFKIMLARLWFVMYGRTSQSERDDIDDTSASF